MAFRSKDDTLGIGGHGPTLSVNLKGCEVTPCVNIAHQKYAIRLAIPSPDGMSDLWIKCETVKKSLIHFAYKQSLFRNIFCARYLP